jgi:CHASE3 domain sensor protein
MLQIFHNLKVGTKIISGYAIALMLMGGVAAVAIYRLEQINRTVTHLDDELARELHTTDLLIGRMLQLQLYANKYILRQTPGDLELYHRQNNELKQFLAETGETVTHVQRAKSLAGIVEAVSQYTEAFAQIEEIIAQRAHVLHEVLNKQGALTEQIIDELSRKVHEANDETTLYHLFQFNRSFLLMRLDSFKYLQEGQAQWAEAFEKSYQAGEADLKILRNSAWPEAGQAELLKQADTAFQAYHAALSSLKTQYERQNQ